MHESACISEIQLVREILLIVVGIYLMIKANNILLFAVKLQEKYEKAMRDSNGWN